MEFLVDPFLVLVPADGGTAEWLTFFERISDWATALRDRDVAASSAIVAELHTSDRYPSVNGLAEAIRKHGVADYSAIDVARALQLLMERQPYVEDVLDVDSVVCVPEPSLEPGLQARLPTPVGQALVSTLLLLATKGHASEVRISTVAVAVQRLTVGTCVVLEQTNNNVRELTFAGCEFRLESTPPASEQLLENVYRNPTLATDIILLELLQNDSVASQPQTIRASAQFAPSLERHAFPRVPRLLRRVFFLAAHARLGRLGEVRGAGLHPVRESIAADAPARTRNGGQDRLMRCAVTKHGAGFRLHYWQCADGSVELDEILVESDV